jgi:hypothetical protein
VTRVTSHLTCGFIDLKSPIGNADTANMTTSEQLSAAQQNAGRRSRGGREFAMAYGVSPEVFQAAVALATSTPDPRMERVTTAVAHLGERSPNARELAEALIAAIREEADR